jgi:hypothetical protein
MLGTDEAGSFRHYIEREFSMWVSGSKDPAGAIGSDRKKFLRCRARLARSSILTLFAVMGLISIARAECTNEELQHFPHAIAAPEQWASKRSLALPQATRNEILDLFCNAAQTAIALKQSVAAIDRVAPQVVSDYLDLELDDSVPMKSMTAILNTALGTAGLARPVARRLARITMTYEGDPEQIRLRGEILPPLASILLPPGRMEIQGSNHGRVVCAGAGDAVVGQTRGIKCGKVK